MPGDKNGRPLKPGDRVTVEFVVVETFVTGHYHDVTLRAVEPMEPGDEFRQQCAYNGRQCVKLPAPSDPAGHVARPADPKARGKQ